MNSLRGISGRSYSFDAEDHLLTAGSVSYQFDADGFLTSKTDGSDVTTYDYSSRGELQSVTLPDGTVISYEHDPLGRRIAKKVNGAVVEKYIWRGMTTLLAVYDGSDNLLMRFEYADDRMPVAAMIGGATYYLAYDQVGTLKAVTNASGTVVKQIDYDSFGNIISDSNPSFVIPFGFAGGLHDRDTGLVRFGYRDYAPEIGRWTAKDPIFFDGGGPNLYGYVACDPINGVDPEGLFLGLKLNWEKIYKIWEYIHVVEIIDVEKDIICDNETDKPEKGYEHLEDIVDRIIPYSVEGKGIAERGIDTVKDYSKNIDDAVKQFRYLWR